MSVWGSSPDVSMAPSGFSGSYNFDESFLIDTSNGFGLFRNESEGWHQALKLDSPLYKDVKGLGNEDQYMTDVNERKRKSSVLDLQTRTRLEKKQPKDAQQKDYVYKGMKYIGPTKKNKPTYKSKQNWEWDIYPHGISKQNGKLRVQIKQKGVNPTYPSFANTLQGLLDAAMFRDKETMRLWDSGVLVRSPKFNFEHPDKDRFLSKRARRRGAKRRKLEKKNQSEKSEKHQKMSMDLTTEVDESEIHFQTPAKMFESMEETDIQMDDIDNFKLLEDFVM
eukprot:CAMPEP_0167758972 /NCGR_PEP_ID=MMETSP0110_2-20121227/10766_1 /TAXON_ID=629695 /ORGANISM="Gymnochlora sp., Strain CCMP2014" /LENGTH=278 /DNA_ID=CAMNT_0007645309 /DNA_START=335 /DNA_END=1171 /DNA_ORIENTATION=+